MGDVTGEDLNALRVTFNNVTVEDVTVKFLDGDQVELEIPHTSRLTIEIPKAFLSPNKIKIEHQQSNFSLSADCTVCWVKKTDPWNSHISLTARLHFLV